MNLLQPCKVVPQSLGRVAVLMGGSSSEREVSHMSGKGVLAALQSRGSTPLPSTPPKARCVICAPRA
jgi:D-alanine--D-alanine ligase (EC 6.3.2.4)